MVASAHLKKLIACVAPLWSGESEVVRSYWDSPVRSHENDLLWMRRQCSKEFNGKGIGEYRNLGVFMGPVTELQDLFPEIDAGIDRHYALGLIEMLHDEFEHYVLIADIYDAIRRPDEPPINAQTLETWDEDVALTELRFKHMRDHGEIGKRASQFTEGGYCSLFREGMALKGRGGADDMIADAFARIFEDEFGHMLSGIIGLDDAGLGEESWTLLGELAVAQMQHRIHMRNGQFGYPVSAERIEAIFAGDITPIEFDYEKAGDRVAA
jgi:hypothetical protein